MTSRFLPRNTHLLPLCLLVCTGLTAAAAARASGVYPGPNAFGAWASTNLDVNDGTNPLILESDMSGPPEQPGPNGELSASNTLGPVTAPAGAVAATSVAHVGYLGGSASAGGCILGLFQQPCDGAVATSEYFDQFHLTGAPDGTPVAITFTLKTNGTAAGFGAAGIASTASDGFVEVEFSFAPGLGPVTAAIADSRSWTRTYIVGINYPLTGRLQVSASEWNCLGGSNFCGVDNNVSVTLGDAPMLSSSLSASLVTPDPRIQLVSASGYPYLAHATKGDVNGDGIVDCSDLRLVKAAFGSRQGQPAYNAAADVNGDGVVNIVDLSTVARALPAGSTCN